MPSWVKLLFRPNRHRRQGNGRDGKSASLNPHAAEQDVSDCLGGALRDEE